MVRFSSYLGNGKLQPNKLGNLNNYGFTGALLNPYIQATGGTEIQLGDYRYHIFNSTDTFEVTALSSMAANNELEVLVVAGGGGGGGCAYGGGGGGGAVTENLNYLLSTNGSIPVVVGAGGAGGSAINDITNQGVNGSDSSFLTLSRLGGGGGGGFNRAGSSGGNGGGGNSNRGGGAGTQGFAGSAGQLITITNYRAGGGGGASQIGQTSAIDKTGSDGGAGVLSQITKVYYGGGGAGGGGDNPGASVGVGGIGGGGGSTTTLSGTANTGGGGAGATYSPPLAGGNGGSGIVIIGYYFPDITGWDAQTALVSARMTLLGSTPSTARYDKMNTLIKNLKGEGFFGTANVWNKLDILQPYYAETAIQSLVEWKMKDGAGVYDATNVNSCSFTANDGYTSSGTFNRYVRTNFKGSNGTNYTATVASFGGIYAAITPANYITGVQNGANNSWIRFNTTDNTNIDQRSNSGGGSGHFGLIAQNSGLFLNNRHLNGAYKLIKNDTITSSISNASTGIPSFYFTAFGVADSDTTNTNVNNGHICRCWIAGGNLEAHRTQLYNSLLAYIS